MVVCLFVEGLGLFCVCFVWGDVFAYRGDIGFEEGVVCIDVW